LFIILNDPAAFSQQFIDVLARERLGGLREARRITEKKKSRKEELRT